jgi:GPH family glycoside/pentoside/hexuronide:cation symporter
MKNTATAARLPLSTKVVYGLGDWGNTTTSTIFIFFFAFFLTDVARLPPARAAMVLLVGGIWDAVNDPIIGVLADRVRTRWGRRRPFFLFVALPLAASFSMMWWVPRVGDLEKTVWYAVAYVLFDTCFTLMTVPYGALTAELTEDYDERTELTGWRMGTSMLGGLVAAFFVPVIVGAFAVPARGYLVAGAGFALLACGPYLMLFFTTKERFASAPRPQTGIFEDLKATLRNRPFRYAAGIYLLAWVTVNLVASLLQYYVTYWLRIPDQLEYVLLVVQGAALACIPLVVWLSGKLGKRGTYALAAGLWAVVMLGLAFVPPSLLALAYALAALAGLGVAGAHVVPWSMVPDVIEVDEAASGARREGAFYGMIVLIQKSGSAFALALVQLILAWTGYAPGQEQPASALLAIRLLIGVAPAVLLGLSMLLAWRSPLGKGEHEAVRRTLEARRAERSAGDVPGSP